MLTKTEAQPIRRVPAATLKPFSSMPCAPAGCPRPTPRPSPGAMLEADLTGSDAHGVFRLAGYVRQLKRGVINPRATIRCWSADRRPR